MREFLSTGSLCREEGNYPSDISDSVFNKYVERASWRVSASVNDYNYIRGLIDSGSEGTRAKKAQKAETFYALSYAVVPLNLKIAKDGYIQTDIGPGYDANTRVTTYTLDQAKELSGYYENEANVLMYEIYEMSASSADTDYSSSYITDGNLTWMII